MQYIDIYVLTYIENKAKVSTNIGVKKLDLLAILTVISATLGPLGMFEFCIFNWVVLAALNLDIYDAAMVAEVSLNSL